MKDVNQLFCAKSNEKLKRLQQRNKIVITFAQVSFETTQQQNVSLSSCVYMYARVLASVRAPL